MPDIYEIVQEDVQQVMNKPPHWMVRAGSAILLSVITVVIVLLCIIRLPQRIDGKFVIDGSGNAVLQFAESDMSGIKAGMPVELHLNAWPSSRFGYITTVISTNADSLAYDHTLSITIPLQRKWQTSEQQEIGLIKGMTGEARIITGRISLLNNLMKGPRY